MFSLGERDRSLDYDAATLIRPTKACNMLILQKDLFPAFTTSGMVNHSWRNMETTNMVFRLL